MKQLFIVNFLIDNVEFNLAFDNIKAAELHFKVNLKVNIKFKPGINNFEILDGSNISGRCFNAVYYA